MYSTYRMGCTSKGNSPLNMARYDNTWDSDWAKLKENLL